MSNTVFLPTLGQPGSLRVVAAVASARKGGSRFVKRAKERDLLRIICDSESGCAALVEHPSFGFPVKRWKGVDREIAKQVFENVSGRARVDACCWEKSLAVAKSPPPDSDAYCVDPDAISSKDSLLLAH